MVIGNMFFTNKATEPCVQKSVLPCMIVLKNSI